MTMAERQFIWKKLRLAGILIATGLVVEAITLVWNHPLSFMLFLACGVLLMVLGIALYLWTIVSPTESPAAGNTSSLLSTKSTSSTKNA